MNPLYAYIAAAWLVSIGAAGWYGMGLGEDRAVAKTAELNKLIEDVEARAQRGAADAIAKNKPVYRTIQAKVETTIREVPVYRECTTTADVAGLLDAARTVGKDANAASSGGLPRAGSLIP
jgi:hypothetical protein